MIKSKLDGWLVYDYKGSNNLMLEILGQIENVTRPIFLWVPVSGQPVLLVSYVDLGQFSAIDLSKEIFVGRTDMVNKLQNLLKTKSNIAMEYSPFAELPKLSSVDAGTIELIKTFGISVHSSADMVVYSTQRWDNEGLDSHIQSGKILGEIVVKAFEFIGDNIDKGLKEIDVRDFIRKKFIDNKMFYDEGPVVAINEHSSDPHFDPEISDGREFKIGDWVLIDLWAKLDTMSSIFSDITWVGYIGSKVPSTNQKVFDIVINARDLAVSEINRRFEEDIPIYGWEVDKIARDYIDRLGYGDYFTHRLGHSIGLEVHASGVNLDGLETFDKRRIIPGIGLTVEPGIYLPEFGARSEIDVYINNEGANVTTPVQKSVFIIN
tara:strand:+ start:8444 stop:9577 length:1134 start_codon:yes stop_codon:yes gene_type:complete